ncbi:MAG: nitrilase-related carbon-nitrogen hydrolase [Phycisphaerales bacterium]
MRLALAQLNPTIGDIPANAARIADAAAKAGNEGADLLAVPELAICGYPPKDLLIHDGFVRACVAACDKVGAAAPPALTLVIGTPLLDEHGGLRNALLVYRGGARIAAYSKRLLPTYDVFDEDRYFEPGDAPVVIDAANVRVGLAICEDLWKGEDAGFSSHYRSVPDPVAELAAGGARVLVVPSASPFVLGKGDATATSSRPTRSVTGCGSRRSTRLAATTTSCSTGTRRCTGRTRRCTRRRRGLRSMC